MPGHKKTSPESSRLRGSSMQHFGCGLAGCFPIRLRTGRDIRRQALPDLWELRGF
jgi:hypothetical protein